MIRILSTDFYKAFRTPSFWIISIVNIFCSLLLSISMFWIFNVFLENPDLEEVLAGSTQNFFQLAPGIISSCTFLIGIFASMFTVSDFNYGTIKNIASKGYRREYIYASKFITILAFAIINLLLSFITSFITAQIMINNKIPDFFKFNNDFFAEISKYSLQLLAYVSVAILLAMLIRSLGASLAVFLAFVFLEGSATQLINKLIHDLFKSDFSITPYTIGGAFSVSSQTTQGIIVLVIYIVLTTAAGIYTFKMRDIN